MKYFAAVDLGASSGRVGVGSFSPEGMTYEVIYRFANEPIQRIDGSFLWNWTQLVEHVIKGLETAATDYELTSVGVDTWAVDYILFDEKRIQSAPAYGYRDHRTEGIMEEVIAQFGRTNIYNKTGIQFLPFNTSYQFLAAIKKGELKSVSRFLMLPDAINFLLCGSTSNEVTNASSTQLLNPYTRSWDIDYINDLGLPGAIFPELHEAQNILGSVDIPGAAFGTMVVAVGSHDTASAVAGTPLLDPEEDIFISSGTWSLVGCEIFTPITSREALDANLTNELGVNGTVRLLKNVVGMWIISELIREWNEIGEVITIEEVVDLATNSPANQTIFDPNDPIFLSPGAMSHRIIRLANSNDMAIPKTRGEFARAVYDSLAQSYSVVIKEIEVVTGKSFTTIHIVGGGSANHLLNQLTADATGLRVVAGPTEATLIGNIGIQALAAGVVKNLQELREIVAKSSDLNFYAPRKLES